MGRQLRLDERGFSLIESSIIFAIIVLIAAAAGLVANRQTVNQSDQLKPNVIQLGTKPGTKSTAPTTTTLELTSLGVNITVPNTLGDLTYAAPNAKGAYGISTKTLTDDDADCVATGSMPPLGSFFKGTGTYPKTTLSEQLVKQFADFYIAWQAPQTPCSTSASVQSLASQQVQLLRQAFVTVEEAPPGSATP